jgi:phage gpG-like protein
MYTLKLELPPGFNKISGLPAAIQANILTALKIGMKNAEDKTIKSYLTGPRPERLGVVSGMLRRSIRGTAEPGSSPGIFAEGVLGSTDVPYAAIHEFGGKTKPHTIVPKDPKGFLVFFWERKGRWVKKKSVNHPGSYVPARPYLLPGLAMTMYRIRNLMQAAIEKAPQDVK